MSELPPGWVRVRLEDIALPVRTMVNPADHPSLPYLGLGHVESVSTKILATDPSSSVRSTSYHFSTGSTLYARLRPYLNKVCTPQFCGIGSGEFIIFPPSPQIAHGFLKYLLNQSAFVDFTSTLDTGDRPRVNWDGIKQFSCGLPPLQEQERIVAAIEEQFSRLDAGVAALERARQNLKRLRTAVLQAAVHELTRDGHPRVRLGDVLREPLRNGHSAKADPTGRIPILTLTAVTLGDFTARNIKMTNANVHRVRDLWVQDGDLLIERSNTRELVGTARLYRGPNNIAVYPDLMIRARVSNQVLPEFAELVLRAPMTRRYFQGRAQGISGSMPKIDQSVIEDVTFSLPPMDMQIRVHAEISRQQTLQDSLELTVKREAHLIASLRASILAAAFSGSLVPQDPSDEPASVLLERIAIERVASQSKQRSSKYRSPGVTA